MIQNRDIIISFKNFSFIYGDDNSQEPAISDISFDLREGEVLILAGPSGSGKSTLSYAINGMIPWRIKGFMKGDVEIQGKSVWDYNFMDLSKNVGLVKQNPLEQLVTFTVRDEIAFGLENLRYPKEEILNRVEEISKFMGIEHLLDRDIEQLSGGQKQLTILCSFLVMKPKVLILDEPIAFLDQNSESLLLDRLNKLVKSEEYNLTLIIIEHRLSRVLNLADKILVLDDNGKICLKGSISDVIKNNFDELRDSNVRVPWILDIFMNLKKTTTSIQKHEIPHNFEEFLSVLNELKQEDLKKLKNVLQESMIIPKEFEKFEAYEEKIEFKDVYIESLKDSKKKMLSSEANDDILLEIQDLKFEYPYSGIKALQNLSIQIERGDFIGLVGPNGSGKTTLLYLLANLYEPTAGKILFKGKNIEDFNPFEYARNIGFIFQNPENMIFNTTIKDEILYGPKNFGILKELQDEYLEKLVGLVGDEDPSKNPFHLSWGQKRRLNLSSIFVYNPDIILLDEPFIGQDQKTIDALVETLYIENKRGKTIIISSHDYHLLLKYTKRIIELNKNGTLKDYDVNGNYFARHKNLGPIILMDRIKEKLGEDRV